MNFDRKFQCANEIVLHRPASLTRLWPGAEAALTAGLAEMTKVVIILRR